MSSSLALDPGEIVQRYSRRFKVEVTYRTLKQVISMLQFLAIDRAEEIRRRHCCWMHKDSSEVPSEE